ncbi:hypothetical protein niasHT_032804 [Heterodera trifolii]|uniref:Transmembrane protein n=1 Tax=Heterodera trifolii TaxID=157864 RepID=A0ABD2IGN2_9BILA
MKQHQKNCAIKINFQQKCQKENLPKLNAEIAAALPFDVRWAVVRFCIPISTPFIILLAFTRRFQNLCQTIFMPHCQMVVLILFLTMITFAADQPDTSQQLDSNQFDSVSDDDC